MQARLVQEEAGAEGQATYGQIVRSTTLIGGSTILKIALGIVRTKAMAMLLGPSGFGLFGLYGSVSDLFLSVAGMGINSSGVRQIAEAAGSGDTVRMAHTAAVLRRTSVVLGVVGAIVLVLSSRRISIVTFGTPQYSLAISLLSLVVLFRLVSDGQAALVQGMRRIGDLAKMNVLGAMFGTIISIPVVYVFREAGIVPSLVAVSGAAIFTSWWYSRKIRIRRHPVSFAAVGREAKDLLSLGFVFMSSGLMTMGVAYLVRLIILRRLGIDATGLYSSAWTLGGLYVGFILQAMGADFYPRLTASAGNNAECNRLVNEQALVGLLLAAPGVVITLTFAPLVIFMFYSIKFTGAVAVLRWICLGTTLQVITWPMGFIIVAKAQRQLFFFAELAWTIVAVSFAWMGVRTLGLSGAGVAFFGSYVFHGFLIYAIVHQSSSFRWSAANKKAAAILLPLIAIAFGSAYVLPVFPAACVGAVAALVSILFSYRILRAIVPFEQLPRPIQRAIRCVLSEGPLPLKIAVTNQAAD